MDTYIINQNLYTNVSEWHEAGFTGKGILVWDMEGLTDHGKKTRMRILDAAPNAKILNHPWNKRTDKDKMIAEDVYDDESKTYLTFAQFVDKHRPKILTCSKGGIKQNIIYPVITPILKEEMRKHNLVIFNSGGNDGGKGVKGGAIPQECAMYIGAVMMFKNDPKDIRECGYSSLGDEFEEIDFSTFVGYQGWNGTSFSTPYMAGIAALLVQRYGDMSQQEIYNYFKMCSVPHSTGPNSIDIDFFGGKYVYDFKTGYGIPVLPPVKNHYITLKIDQKTFKLDGEFLAMDTAPFIKDQRTYVPISWISLAMGSKVTWKPLRRTVTIVKGRRTIELTIDKRYYYVNGKRYEMEVAPFIKDNRTFVPIAVVALALGCRVAWCNDERMVQILEVEE